jgi:hypothetical protein
LNSVDNIEDLTEMEIESMQKKKKSNNTITIDYNPNEYQSMSPPFNHLLIKTIIKSDLQPRLFYTLLCFHSKDHKILECKPRVPFTDIDVVKVDLKDQVFFIQAKEILNNRNEREDEENYEINASERSDSFNSSDSSSSTVTSRSKKSNTKKRQRRRKTGLFTIKKKNKKSNKTKQFKSSIRSDQNQDHIDERNGIFDNHIISFKIDQLERSKNQKPMNEIKKLKNNSITNECNGDSSKIVYKKKKFQIFYQFNAFNGNNGNGKSNCKTGYNKLLTQTNIYHSKLLPTTTSSSSSSHFSKKNKKSIITTQKIQLLSSFVCPFCYLNCRVCGDLINHLQMVHYRMKFEIQQEASVLSSLSSLNETNVTKIESSPPPSLQPEPQSQSMISNGEMDDTTTKRLQINVFIDDTVDNSYAGNPYDLYYSAYLGVAGCRFKPTKRPPVTYVLVNK